MTNPQSIKFKNKVYTLVRVREHTEVSIYKNDDLFLRIGPKGALEPEIDFHKKLIQYHFPVPRIVAEGKWQSKYFYLETSLGGKSFSSLFWGDWQQDGQIKPRHFNAFLKISKEFAQAQLGTVVANRDEESFYLGAKINFAILELPNLKNDILKAFAKVKKQTESLPYVLTHGDFNPANLFPKGVIDFGNHCYAPAGMDLISSVYLNYNFPKKEGFESQRKYEFSKDQLNQYFGVLDRIYHQAGLPALSNFIDDFIFCRYILSLVRMEKKPKLQKWRYEKFNSILETYLTGKSLIALVTNF